MKAVVFDMDGVLVDTERIGKAIWVEVAKEMGCAHMEQRYLEVVGRNQTDITVMMKEWYGEAFPYGEFREKVLEKTAEYVDKNGLPVKEGTLQLLSWMKETGWKIGLASSSSRKIIERNLKSVGVLEYFSEIVSGDMVEHSKPCPDIYLMACERLGVPPGETYAVEDSPNGIKAAYRAGMRPLLVPDLIPPEEEMNRLSKKVCRDLLEIKEFLEKEESR